MDDPVFIGIGILVIASLVLFASTFETPQKEQEKRPQKKEENEAPPPSPKPSVSRTMYQSVKRNEERLKKQQDELSKISDEQLHASRKLELEKKNLELGEVRLNLDTDKNLNTVKEAMLNLDAKSIEAQKIGIELEMKRLTFEKSKVDFSIQMRLKLMKLTMDKYKFDVAQYVQKQFNSIERQKIHLAFEQSKTAKQKFDLYMEKRNLQLSKDMERVSRREWELKMKTWDEMLKIKGGKINLQQSQFSYLENRIFKDYGYEGFDEYFKHWGKWDSQARSHGYENAEKYVDSMLYYGGHNRLAQYQQKYLELQSGS